MTCNLLIPMETAVGKSTLQSLPWFIASMLLHHPRFTALLPQDHLQNGKVPRFGQVNKVSSMHSVTFSTVASFFIPPLFAQSGTSRLTQSVDKRNVISDKNVAVFAEPQRLGSVGQFSNFEDVVGADVAGVGN